MRPGTRRHDRVGEGFTAERERGPDGASRLVVRGRVDFDSVEDLRRRVEEAARQGCATLDFAGVDCPDSSMAGLLLSLRRAAAERRIPFEVVGADRVSRTLLSLVDPKRLERPAPASPVRRPFVETVGAAVLDALSEGGRILQFTGEVTLTLLRGLRRPATIRWGEVALFLQRTGTEALPIVALLSALVGLVTAFSSAIQLRQFGANVFIANLIGIGMTREMGPLLAAILLTGRSGSAFAAEIGTMKISDEVDALTVMGIRPMEYLVLPRLLAVMIALPLLALFADLCGIAGGMVIATVTLDLSPITFVQQLGKAIGLWDVFSGVLKSFVFGLLVASIGCYRGLETRGGAMGVGLSTTASVVSGIFFIVVADSVFVVLFHYLGLG